MNLQIDKVIKGANEKINFFEQKLEYINNLRDPNQPQNESEFLYNNIKNQIQKFNSNFDNNIDNILSGIMNNNNQTVQRNPLQFQSLQNMKNEINFPKIENKRIYVNPNPKKQKPIGKKTYVKKDNEPPKLKEFKKIYKRKQQKDQLDLALENQPIILHNPNDRYKQKQILTLQDDCFQANTVLDQDQFLPQQVQSVKLLKQPIQKIKPFQNDYFDSKNQLDPMNMSYENMPKEYQEIEHQVQDYNQILDQFSLHQFIIRKGKTLIETEEFKSYQRTYLKQWNRLQLLINQLENFYAKNNINTANVDGKKLLKFINKTQLTSNDCVVVLVNAEKIANSLKIPNLMFQFENKKELATVFIQKMMKGYIQRQKYYRLKALLKYVKVIQNFFRMKIFQKQIQVLIQKKNNDIFKRYQKRQNDFKYLWPQIKFQKKIEIHINSLSLSELTRLSMQKFLQKQNTQITRLFKLQDPMLEIIYISPFELSQDILNYYSKVLQLGNISNYKERLYFLSPENVEDFPSHYSLSQMLIYSPKVIKRIKKIIKNKEAYIVPGQVSNDDIKLSDLFNVPIMAGEPQKTKILNSKSGCMNFLNGLDIPIPLGIYEIYDLDEFYNSLAQLINKNIDNDMWIFKIDNEFNSIVFLKKGRGLATLDISKFKVIKELRNQQIKQDYHQIIKEILMEKLPHKINIVQKTLYKNFDEYIKFFIQKGGLIEVMPDQQQSKIKTFSVFFLIEPDSEIMQLGTYDKISANQYVTLGCCYPQTSLQNFNSQVICQMIGQALYKQNIFGYVSVDFITFKDSKNANQQLFWAIGLDCYLNNYSSAFFYFDFMVNGSFDPKLNNYTISLENNTTTYEYQNERYFFYTPFLFHPGLTKIHYNTFFHMCRIEHVYYDIDKKSGATFFLLDCLQTGVLSLIGIGKDRFEICQIMNKALQFIMNMNGNINDQFQDFSRSDQLQFQDVFSKVKMMLKQEESKQKKNQN